MPRLSWKRGLIAGLALASGVVLAQVKPTKFDFGRHEYDEKCASCHGPTGKGDGVNRPWLDKSPADLTTLSRSHGGEFPYEEVYAAIDGRQDVEEHGPRDMPAWGTSYLEAEAGDHQDVPRPPDVYVETRLVALVDHVRDLQVK